MYPLLFCVLYLVGFFGVEGWQSLSGSIQWRRPDIQCSDCSIGQCSRHLYSPLWLL